METIVGRPLELHEHVHHIDGDKANNNPGNLLLLTAADHHKLNHFLALLNSSSEPSRAGIALTLKLRFPDLFNQHLPDQPQS